MDVVFKAQVTTREAGRNQYKMGSGETSQVGYAFMCRHVGGANSLH